ncbi:phage tail protein [Flavobacterium branchiophilum]
MNIKLYTSSRKIFILFSFLFFLKGNAQAPEKMSYQAVIRNSSNALVSNANVGIKISILQGTATGTEVYSQTQTATTNVNGLVSLTIGEGGFVSGDFVAINWGNGPYFIKTETDPTGGANYTITSTTQLLSVPFAMYAKNGVPSQTNQAGKVLTTDGTSASWTKMLSDIGVRFYIKVGGTFSWDAAAGGIGTIVMHANNNNTFDWGDYTSIPCDGRSLLISQYSALFSVLGTTYGGDGVTTFKIPNLNNGLAPKGRN